jgi:signal transduction histidine kinase
VPRRLGAVPGGDGGLDQRLDVVALVAVMVDLTLFSGLALDPAPFHDPTVHPMLDPMPLMTIAFAAVGCALLWLRTRAPFTVLLALCAHAVVTSMVLPYRPVTFVCVALASVAMRAPLRLLAASVLPVGGALFAWVSAEVRITPDLAHARVIGTVVGYGVCLLAALCFGLWRRVTLERVELADQARDEAARAAVAEERLRVARELHDIVAHAVTVMVLQAAGARQVLRHEPCRAEDALAAVQDEGVQAIEELRRLLSVLRSPQDAPATATDQPGLRDVGTLVDGVRRSGVRVEVRHSGTPRRLNPSIDVAAYRVLQEALTNVTKHAGAGASAEVQLRWSPDALVLEVRDDGRGTHPHPQRLSTGHGLLGLGERIMIVGGELTTARLEDGGFRLTASMPVVQDCVPAEITPP